MTGTLVPRVLVVVCDSWGVGDAPDAADYGDEASDTLANTADAVGGIRAPNLASLGLGSLTGIRGVDAAPAPGTAHGRATERSAGKDTTTGHWEMMGIRLDEPFPLYPNGFPPDLIGAFEQEIGKTVLGNRAASGTEIIAELGEEHLRTGGPIVYTSGDSVFQIATQLTNGGSGLPSVQTHDHRLVGDGRHAHSGHRILLKMSSSSGATSPPS